MLNPGLYEQVINKDISEKLDTSEQIIDKREIDKAEAPQILSGYLSEIIEKGLSRFGSDDIGKKLELANKIVNATFENYWNSTDFSTYSADDREHLLQALKAEKHHSDNSDYSFDIRPFLYQQEILDKLNGTSKNPF